MNLYQVASTVNTRCQCAVAILAVAGSDGYKACVYPVRSEIGAQSQSLQWL
jgi:hypothetical protein